MIAVVLLVAFTVAVGGILSLWLTSYTTSTTGNVETATTNQTKCAGSYIDVISVTSDAVLITTRGSETLSNVNCFVGNGTNVTSVAVTSLGSGAINSGTWSRETETSILCTGSCLNIGISGECKSGQSCWK